jgi:hypothetical protein
MGDALLADFQPAIAAPAKAAVLDAVRVSVGNGSVARHFWETALGLHFVYERDLSSDWPIRDAWNIRRGSLRLTRLEIAPDTFPKVELLEWEGCSGQPIRDARHPWDYGLLALRIPVSNLDARLAHVAQWRCKVDRNGPEASVTTPGGERVILRQGGEPAVIAVVPSLETAKGFFRESLMLPNGLPVRAEKRFSGAASVESVQSLRLGSLEVMELRRSADPRPAMATGSRMHAGYTGYCMLSVTGSRPVDETRSALELLHGPGGIPVELVSPCA